MSRFSKKLFCIPTRARSVSHKVELFNHIITGFVLGAGIASLLSFISATIPYIILFGIVFSMSYALRAFLKNHRLDREEEKYSKEGLDLLQSQTATPQKNPKPGIVARFAKIIKKKFGINLERANSTFLDISDTLFNIFSIPSIAVILFPTLISFGISLPLFAVFAIMTILVITACFIYVARYMLRARIKKVHQLITEPKPEKIEEIVYPFDGDNKRLVTNKFIYGFMMPSFEAVASALTTAATTFGIISLLGIGIPFAIPLLSPIAIAIISLSFGFVHGIKSGIEKSTDAQNKIDYLNSIARDYQNFKDRGEQSKWTPISQNKYEKMQLRSERAPKKHWFTELLKDGVTLIADILEHMGACTGFLLVLLTITSMVGISITPIISIPLIIALGALYTALTMMCNNICDSNDQRKHIYDMIDSIAEERIRQKNDRKNILKEIHKQEQSTVKDGQKTSSSRKLGDDLDSTTTEATNKQDFDPLMFSFFSTESPIEYDTSKQAKNLSLQAA